MFGKVVAFVKSPWAYVILWVLTYPFLVYFLTNSFYIVSCWRKVDQTGPLGDTLGGIISGLVGPITAIAVFITYRQQLDANKEAREQFEEEIQLLRSSNAHQQDTINATMETNRINENDITFRIMADELAAASKDMSKFNEQRYLGPISVIYVGVQQQEVASGPIPSLEFITPQRAVEIFRDMGLPMDSVIQIYDFAIEQVRHVLSSRFHPIQRVVIRRRAQEINRIPFFELLYKVINEGKLENDQIRTVNLIIAEDFPVNMNWFLEDLIGFLTSFKDRYETLSTLIDQLNDSSVANR